MAVLSGLLQAILDAIQGQDELIAGQRITQLTTPLLATDTEINVVSTIGFGENRDGMGDAKIIIDGEIIYASGRTDTTFTGLTRGVDNTKTPELHIVDLLAHDLARNSSALDLVRRGFLVAYAIRGDLDVIGRNLGLKKCSGWIDSIWRNVIEDVAYLAKQPITAFHVALEAVFDPGDFQVVERLITHPYTVYIYVTLPLANSLHGQFFINGGERQDSTGLLEVKTANSINDVPLDPGPGSVGVFGVYDDTPLARRGVREGLFNYFPGGSFVGDTITLGVSPGAVGTPLIIDYNAFAAHYVTDPESVVDDEDFFPYFSDNLSGIRCLLDQVRAAGIKLELRNRP